MKFTTIVVTLMLASFTSIDFPALAIEANPYIHTKFKENPDSQWGRSMDDSLLKPTEYRKFDEQEWLKSNADRISMVRDLLLHRNIIGMQKNKLEKLLGKPTSFENGIAKYALNQGIELELNYLKDKLKMACISLYNADIDHTDRSRWISETSNLDKLDKLIDCTNDSSFPYRNNNKSQTKILTNFEGLKNP